MSEQLTLTPPEEKRPHKRVRTTSRAVYEIGRERFTGRKAIVLRHLAAYWNERQESPTSAELAHWLSSEYKHTPWLELLLYVRRGLSDLDPTGIVETPEKRPCRVCGNVCVTWRIVERGTSPIETR